MKIVRRVYSGVDKTLAGRTDVGQGAARYLRSE